MHCLVISCTIFSDNSALARMSRIRTKSSVMPFCAYTVRGPQKPTHILQRLAAVVTRARLVADAALYIIIQVPASMMNHLGVRT